MTTLDVFRAPESVAVVGATDNPAKWGHWLARGAIAGAHRRRVHLVNMRGGEVLDRRSHPSLDALPEVPDLVAFAVPASALASGVRDAVALGVPGLLAITAGVEDEAAIVDVIAASATRLLGPNCLGLYDASGELELAWGRFAPGSLAIVSQSGQLGLEIAGMAASAGIGVSRFVSVGSQLDVGAAELLADLAHHEATRVVAVYLESFGDGERLLDALDRLRDAGKPVLLLTVGASKAARQAARSHTGSMTSGIDVVDAACRTVGAVRVESPVQLVDTATLLLRSAPVRGRRVAIVADSGGQGAVAADTASRLGLTVVEFSPEVQERLAAQLPPHAAVANPVDLAGAGEEDVSTYASTPAVLADTSVTDAVVLTGYFGSYGRDIPGHQAAESEVARAIGSLAAERALPIVVHSMAEHTNTVSELRSAGVPTFTDIEAALRAVETAHRFTQASRPRVPHASAAKHRVAPGAGYSAARELLADAGVPFPAAVGIAPGTPDPRAAMRSLSAPVVLKADWLEHKTEHGGVATELHDAAALGAAYDDMVARLGSHGYVVEEMDRRTDVVEVIVAARRDPSFGPVVVVGAGGVQAELTQDLALELAPCSHDTAREMIRRLRSWPLLAGWRGSRPVDVDALAAVVVAVSQLIVDRGDLGEIELNPVRVSPEGALAVDALVIAVPASDSPSTP
ncbi:MULTISPECIES: acetate--CoA ligase family protein [unclassified Streptomyces]|uniref:acetate--CoA ligase family protein n=1 Tax=unclassified Streptomyces TaxID=2593676 RepID=UPI002DDA6DA2|nr:acetate--CoA ligase family protein [Streptomyces sp. NBC_01445]WSE09548.1 acetate--CoA ligase family protein [Streptomyces sp. NBC_01445]